MTSTPQDTGDWKEEFEKVWRKHCYVGHSNSKPVTDFIETLLQAEREKMIELLDEEAFEQDEIGEVKLYLDWDKAKEILSDNNQ